MDTTKANSPPVCGHTHGVQSFSHYALTILASNTLEKLTPTTYSKYYRHTTKYWGTRAEKYILVLILIGNTFNTKSICPANICSGCSQTISSSTTTQTSRPTIPAHQTDIWRKSTVCCGRRHKSSPQQIRQKNYTGGCRNFSILRSGSRCNYAPGT